MTGNRYQFVFFLIFILAVLVLNAFVFLPYIPVLFLATLAVIVFDPIHEWLKRKLDNSVISALVAVLLLFILVVGPLSFFGTLLFKEAADLYTNIIRHSDNVEISNVYPGISNFLGTLFPASDLSSLEIDFQVYAEKALSFALSHLTDLFSGVAKILFGMVLFFLASFYFFLDGKKLVSSLVDLSPLNDRYDRKIIEKIVSSVKSVVLGRLLIALIQGLLTAVGFGIFGIGNPALIGAITILLSLIPSIGTAIVFVPAVLWLFLSGHGGGALGLALWGGLLVGLVDNFLGPIFMKKGLNVHPFLILLSALGGVGFFGPIGFMAGPVLISILFALLDIYPDIVADTKG